MPIWYLGTFVFVAGSLLNFVSFGFAAQSLLAALGSAQFISNVFFGKVVLGEEVTRSTLLATFIIILGNAIVVNFSSHTSVVYTADDLISFYDGDFNGYAGCMIVLAIASRFIYKRIDDRVKVGEVRTRGRGLRGPQAKGLVTGGCGCGGGGGGGGIGCDGGGGIAILSRLIPTNLYLSLTNVLSHPP